MIPEIISMEPNQLVIQVAKNRYYFSYLTCVAYANFDANIRIRRNQNYSRTTAKHMMRMGVSSWDQVSDEDFQKIMEQNA